MNNEELTARRHELVACADKLIICLNELVDEYTLSWFDSLGLLEIVKFRLKENMPKTEK